MSEFYGHPYFHQITAEETDLHNRKNHDYAKGGDALGNFKRVGTILGLYPGLDPSDPAIVAATYALKQMDAYLWGKAQKLVTKVEGPQERLGDWSIYAKLIRCIEKDKEDALNAVQKPG